MVIFDIESGRNEPIVFICNVLYAALLAKIKLLSVSILICAAAVTMITATGFHPSHAAFPGDNGDIVFVSERDGNREIYSIHPDGSGLSRLTQHSTSDQEPSWSPDSTRIAFNRGYNIYVMNADGSGVIQLTNSGVASDPAWSPDGGKIAFDLLNQGVRKIYIINAEGGGLTYLSGSPGLKDRDPAWSPDGTRIAFVAIDRIYVMHADGSGATALSPGFSSSPSWSPDGTKIAFVYNGDIYLMNEDGSGQALLVASGNFPSWSPDGTKIVFSKNDGIYIVNAVDGGSQTKLLDNNSIYAFPDWGRSLTSPSTQQHALTITAVSLSDGQVLNMWTTVQPSGVGDASLIGFTPLSFAGDSGKSYIATVSDYQDIIFDHWENGSTSRSRIITPSTDTTITAYYTTSSLRGFTSLIDTGKVQEPGLTVNAVSLGGETLHMWTIVQNGGTSSSGTSYTVTVSDYQDIIFDHWENGSTSRTRTFTISAATTVTAYYRTS